MQVAGNVGQNFAKLKLRVIFSIVDALALNFLNYKFYTQSHPARVRLMPVEISKIFSKKY